MKNFTDFDVTEGQSSPFPIDLVRGPYTTVQRYRMSTSMFDTLQIRTKQSGGIFMIRVYSEWFMKI